MGSIQNNVSINFMLFQIHCNEGHKRCPNNDKITFWKMQGSRRKCIRISAKNQVTLYYSNKYNSSTRFMHIFPVWKVFDNRRFFYAIFHLLFLHWFHLKRWAQNYFFLVCKPRLRRETRHFNVPTSKASEEGKRSNGWSETKTKKDKWGRKKANCEGYAAYITKVEKNLQSLQSSRLRLYTFP